jgi:hypothetical protein
MTTKPDISGLRRWRFSLKSLLIAVAFLSVFLAITITGGRTEEMGQTGIHARHYGWPVAYLRVPTGEYADKVPADVFVPGLLVDLIVAAVLFAAVLSAWRAMRTKENAIDEHKDGGDVEH